MSDRLTHRIGALVVSLGLAAGLLTATAPAASAATPVSSTFDTDAEGWTVQADPAPGSPSHQATGGNPGGFLRTVDGQLGGYMFWQAPAKFLGDRTAFYGGTISYDARQNVAALDFLDDVVLVGNGLELQFDTAKLPTGTWATRSALLTEAGWTIRVTGAAIDQATFRSVLADVDGLLIRAENTTAIDTDDLDGVVLAPAPATQVSLTPETATLEAGGSHCVTATVGDAYGVPVEGARVLIAVTGASSSSTSSTTPLVGTVGHCYPGPAAAGVDTITATVDSDADGIAEPGEPTDTATVTWTVTPPPTEPAPHMTARAYGGSVSLLGGLIPLGPFGDTGPVNVSTSTQVHRQVLAWGQGGLGLKVLSGDVVAVNAPGSANDRVDAVGRVAAASIDLIGLKLRLEGVTATSSSTCTSTSGSTVLAKLTVNGQTILADATASPNTSIPLVVGKLVLNEQVTTAAGHEVRGVHLVVPGVADITLGYARSAIDCG